MSSDLPPLPKSFVGCAILQLVAGVVALNAGILALTWGCTLGYIATGIWVGSVVSMIPIPVISGLNYTSKVNRPMLYQILKYLLRCVNFYKI